MSHESTRRFGAATITSAVTALAVTACGQTTPASHHVSTTHTPTAVASPQPTSSDLTAADLSVTVDEVGPAAGQFLPPGETLAQTSEGLFKNNAGTYQRTFATADNVYMAAVDVLPYSSVSSAMDDYSSARSYAASGLSGAMHSTPSIGDEADEYVGQPTNSPSATLGFATISFREKNVLVVVTWGSANGVVIPDIAEAIAKAEDARIIQLG